LAVGRWSLANANSFWRIGKTNGFGLSQRFKALRQKPGFENALQRPRDPKRDLANDQRRTANGASLPMI
jgi:hypothetical protein